MRTINVQEFHDHVTQWLRSKEPVVITKYGKSPLGIYYPASIKETPKEVRWAIFEALTDQIGERMKKKGIAEGQILDDFREWRMKNAKARH